jgi:hypothetical protein
MRLPNMSTHGDARSSESERLAGKYPDVDRERISEIVAEEHHGFDDRPVRDFVPVLVEKSAKKRVKALAAD